MLLSGTLQGQWYTSGPVSLGTAGNEERGEEEIRGESFAIQLVGEGIRCCLVGETSHLYVFDMAAGRSRVISCAGPTAIGRFLQS